MSGITVKPQEKPVAPIILCAQAVKKQLEETKTLAATLENREAKLRQLKLAAKLKTKRTVRNADSQELGREEAVGVSAGSRNEHRPTVETVRRSLPAVAAQEGLQGRTLRAVEGSDQRVEDDCNQPGRPKDERIEQLEQETTRRLDNVPHPWRRNACDPDPGSSTTRTNRSAISSRSKRKLNSWRAKSWESM